MKAHVEIEFDNTIFSITQEWPEHGCHSASRVCATSAVMTLGQCAGQMISALLGRVTEEYLDGTLGNFNAVVVRAARNPSGIPPARFDRLHESEI